MSASKHFSLSFYYKNTKNRIITPVDLFSIPYNSSLHCTIDALWDTGASMSAITPEIRDKLKASPVDRKEIAGVHSTEFVDIVFITVALPNNVIKKNIRAAVCSIPSDIGMILGMDIISLGDFALSNSNNETLFSFSFPPFPEKIDFSKR